MSQDIRNVHRMSDLHGGIDAFAAVAVKLLARLLPGGYENSYIICKS